MPTTTQRAEPTAAGTFSPWMASMATRMSASPSAILSTACEDSIRTVPVLVRRAISTPRTRSLGHSGRMPFMSVPT